MHSVAEIEEKIRRRYHQPKGVEQFGIEPVPPELKTVWWHDIFAIIFGFALNPGSMLVGGMAVVSGLSFWGALGAITCGVLLATVAYTITATVGVDYGLPGQVSMRMVYGLRGAKWVPSFLRTIASTYWFAYQTVAGWLLFVTWLNVVAAGSLTMVTDSADFCRYTRSRTDMWWGTLLGKVGGGCFAACLGAYGAAATLGKTPNVFEVASKLTTSWFVLLLFLIVIALDNWTINVLNLYTGGLSLSNMFERLGRFWTTVIISILGIALSATPDVVKGYTTYVGILGNVFSPIGGVLIADYLFVKRMQVDI